MDNLVKQTDPNIGGARLIKICPVHLVESIDEKSRPAEVVFKSGGQWFNIYSVPDSIIVSDQPSKVGGEDVINAVIDSKYPGDSGIVSRFFERLSQYRFFIVFVKDSNLNTRLFGTLECPMEFSYTHALGSGTKGFRGYSYSFKGKLQKTPPRILE